jgi:hypothetical protein
MRDSNARKSAFLGIPHGTASHRLRKLILFDLIRRLGENVCFRCSQEIEHVDDLSIEHKQPWEGVSVELFWSLDNIAFSHLHCNLPHSYRGGGARKRKVGPEGTAWCRRCKDFRVVAEFGSNKTRWNGLQAWCNQCLSEYKRRGEYKRREQK